MSEFVEVKTAELVGAALDWAVAQAEGLPALAYKSEAPYVYIDLPGRGCGPYLPSHAWFEGGLLVSKFLIEFTVQHKTLIFACLSDENGMPIIDGEVYGSFGPTHLVAACRAIVLTKIGPVASVPRELLP